MDVFLVIFVRVIFLFAWKIMFLSDAEAYSEPFQRYFKHKMELLAKIAIGYFGKKLHLRCLIGDASRYMSLDPRPPYCWHRVNTYWLKIIETAIFRNIDKKTLVWSLFFIKLQAHVLKALQHTCLPVNIAKALRTAFLIGRLQRLLLKLDLY